MNTTTTRTAPAMPCTPPNRKPYGDQTCRMVVEVRALSAKEVSPGVFAIEIPAERLSIEHSKMLQEMFPNLAEKAHEVLDSLLVREALIASVVDPKAE